MKFITLITVCLCIYNNLVAQPGTLDYSLNPGAGPDREVYACVLQPDGKIILGGDFSFCQGYTRHGVLRMHPNGSVDTGFDPGGGTGEKIFCVALVPGGKILVSGTFTSFDGVPMPGIALLNSDGSLDSLFDPGAGPNGDIMQMEVDVDGKIFLLGTFTEYDGYSVKTIAKINGDGSPDTTFNMGFGFSGAVYSILLQPDGKILAGGSLDAYKFVTPVKDVARLNPDGSLDLTFSPVSGLSSSGVISTMALQADGKIIICGNFLTWDGVSRKNIARINTDGTLDLTFDPGSGPDWSISEVAIAPDGKIIIADDFDHYNGVYIVGIAEINPDGSLFAAFDPGSSAGSINAITPQPDGRIIIAGNFNSYDGIGRLRIARINNELTGVTEFESNGIRVFPNPFKGSFHILPEKPGLTTISDATGRVIYQGMTGEGKSEINLENSPAGIYTLKLEADDAIRVCKIIHLR